MHDTTLQLIAQICIAMSMLAFYLLPTIVAKCRRHNNYVSLGLLNILLGWTLLGWVGALIWSFAKPANVKESE